MNLALRLKRPVFVRGWFALCLLGAVFLSGQSCLRAEEARQAPATTHFAPGLKAETHTYRVICDQPRNREYADLCMQWRVAEAAEGQFLANVISTGLLVFTLIFTAWAATAASRAARHAGAAAGAAITSAEADREANALARQHAEIQLRAYVTVKSSVVVNLKVGEAPRVVICAVNAGQTPAVDFASHYGAGFVLWPHDSPPIPERPNDKGTTTLGPGMETWIYVDLPVQRQQEVQALIDGSAAIHAIGRFQYKDIFGKEHVTTFDVVYGGSFGVPDSGAMKHNYHGNAST